MHSALRPQGDGLHGSITSIGLGVAKKPKLATQTKRTKETLTAGAVALGKRVANEPLVAETQGHMVAHFTVCIDATEAWTRVLALSVDASPVSWAVSIHHTLRPAVGR